MINPKHPDLKRVETKPYSYIPAAITFASDGGIGIYIKYGKYPDRIVVKETGHNYVWVQCPDREIVMVANSHWGWGFRPMNGTFDEYVHIGPYHDHLNADMNLPYFMVNYVAESSKKVANSRKDVGTERDPNSLIVADSGGYQILQGRVEYLDPLKIIEWYNDNVDIGFSLDIPANNRTSNLLKRAAKIQARNNDIMMSHKKDGLELINVLHGATKEDMLYYREVVDRPDMDRMAFGSLYHYYDLLASVDLMYRIANTGQAYKHIHVLGVSNSLHTALLIRMATNGLMPHLTSDSSTPMQKARLREWHNYSSTQEKVKFMLVGYKDGYRPSSHNILPCSCQVCSAIKYSDVLWCLSGNIAHKVFEFHNIHSMSRYFDVLTEYSKECSTREFKQLLKAQVGENRQGFDEAMHALDFMDLLAKGNVDTARDKYKLYLGSGLFSEMGISVADEDPESLFKNAHDPELGDPDDEYVDISESEVEKVILRYEDVALSSTLKHGKKLKTDVANTRKTKNTSGGANTKPITAAQIKKKNVERNAEKQANIDKAKGEKK